MNTVVLFDVNETLLDLRVLEPLFARAFGSAQAREVWFRQMLLLAFQATILDQYRPFGEHARAALRMLSHQLERPLSASDEQAILDQTQQLPAFPDVAPGLARLRQADFRLAALTNSTEAVGTAQLRHAGILDQFERVFSADRVRRLKPAPEPYRMAVHEMGVAPEGVWLVAAHGWDVAGAAAVGCRTAFLARPGKVLDPLAQSDSDRGERRSARGPTPRSGRGTLNRGWLKALALAAAVAALVILGRRAGGLVPVVAERVARMGAWGPIAFIGVYVVGDLVLIPGSVLSLAGGALFGFIRGTLLVFLASTLGAVAAFLVAW